MAEPFPTNNAPIGTPNNTFRIDPMTTSLTQTPLPGTKGLITDPWPNITLRVSRQAIREAEKFFALQLNKEIMGVGPQMLHRYARKFSGKNGARFFKRVKAAASEAEVNPGLLAAVCLFERGDLRFWTRRSGSDTTYEAGSDYFYARRHRIRKVAPASRSIRILKTEEGTNELGNKTVDATVHVKHLVFVTACYLKERISVMRRIYDSEGGFFDGLPDYMRFFLSRLIFNPGKRSLRYRSKQILSGKNILRTKGSRSPKRPLRGATICAAVAVWLNHKYFNQ